MEQWLVQGTGPSYSTANLEDGTLVPAQLRRYTGWQTTLNLTDSWRMVRGSRHQPLHNSGAAVGHMTAIEIARCTRECAWSLVSLTYKTKTRIFHFINEAFSGECTKWVLSSAKVVCNITEPVIRILLVHTVLRRWVKYFYYRYSYSGLFKNRFPTVIMSSQHTDSKLKIANLFYYIHTFRFKLFVMIKM
jgi:hypothetical protein